VYLSDKMATARPGANDEQTGPARTPSPPDRRGAAPGDPARQARPAGGLAERAGQAIPRQRADGARGAEGHPPLVGSLTAAGSCGR